MVVIGLNGQKMHISSKIPGWASLWHMLHAATYLRLYFFSLSLSLCECDEDSPCSCTDLFLVQKI